MATGSSTVGEPATEIRPGVFRPDWSAVTKPAAREALGGRMAARAGLLDAWSHTLGADEDLVWRAVLHLYADKWRAPRPDEVAAEAGIAGDHVAALLRGLQRRDLVGLDPGSGAIRHAYPFTESATGHQVKFRGHSLYALCAIDALGIAGMYGTDVLVRSPCRSCGETVHVATADKGRMLREVAPAGAVVWYDFAFSGSAAASSCTATAFFCSDDHLRRWLDGQTPRREGARLAMDEALEMGRAIFGPVLAEAKVQEG